MSTGGANPLMHVAEAISDGTPVNWEREKTRDPDLAPALDHLAVLEQIRDLHRSAGAAGDTARTADAALTADATRTADATASAATGEDTRPGTGIPASSIPLPFHWGTLRVVEKIGEGASSEVFRAVDPSLQTDVALKLLKDDVSKDASVIESFLSEARRLARVRHTSVLVVHGADRHGGRAGLWTELLRGSSLEKQVARQGPMSAKEAALIGLDLCKALSAVHAAGLVHRDVKASNVMREEGGRIVLTDFGSVGEMPRRGIGRTMHIHGTPLSMAPEQLRGVVTGPACDVYGLGALLYHLVSGKYPVEAESLEELKARHERRERIPLRDRRADLPLDFVQVVERALASDAAERYPTAGAMEQALAATVAPKRNWYDWIASHRGWAAAAAAAVILVSAGIYRIVTDPPWKHDDAVRSTDGRAAPSTTPAALQVRAEFARRAGLFNEPLPPGGRVKPGDRLSLLLDAPEPTHVYVLNVDRTGNVFVLYPIPGVAPTNPLAPGVRHRLPGKMGDSLVYWNVTSAGDRETMVAIAARAPLAELESEIARIPRARPGGPPQFPRVEAGTLRRLRGVGGLQVEPPGPEVGGSPGAAETVERWVRDMIAALEARRAKAGDVWVLSAEFENPRPRR